MNYINIREPEKLVENVRNVRVSCFSQPSSFYVQIIGEDEAYQSLENEMSVFYDAISFFYSRINVFQNTTEYIREKIENTRVGSKYLTLTSLKHNYYSKNII